MLVQFSDKEASIVLGATLMHWGVPFHRAEKRVLIDQQQAIVDAASDKLIASRKATVHSKTRDITEVSLSDQEIALLAEVVENCLAECGDDAVDLDLHLHSRDCKEVEALSIRLRRFLQREQAKPA
jgi:hypothetical protein